MKNKYVIGTHVMWFEIEMFSDFIDMFFTYNGPVFSLLTTIIGSSDSI